MDQPNGSAFNMNYGSKTYLYNWMTSPCQACAANRKRENFFLSPLISILTYLILALGGEVVIDVAYGGEGPGFESCNILEKFHSKYSALSEQLSSYFIDPSFISFLLFLNLR